MISDIKIGQRSDSILAYREDRAAPPGGDPAAPFRRGITSSVSARPSLTASDETIIPDIRIPCIPIYTRNIYIKNNIIFYYNARY